MGAITHSGEVLQKLPADASQVNFDKTGTNLTSTQTENAIKEVNTKVNTNTNDIAQLMSGLTSRLMIAQTNIEGVDFSTFVTGIFNYANGLIGDNSSIMINAYWVGQNNYTAIVYKGNSNFLYAIIFCSPAIYQADYISGVMTSRPVQLVS